MRSAAQNRRRDDSNEFFAESGSGWMKLSRDAAIQVCILSAARGFVVARVEGGIWRDPGFEARLDSIWDGSEPPISVERAAMNNASAVEHLRHERTDYDAFIITAPPITGWPHLRNRDHQLE